MRHANPAMPPQAAVTASPRIGSASLSAISAPPTAPKNEAAHARKGVSSHPKMRKSRRTQRIGSGAALPHRGHECGQGQSGEKRHPQRAERPTGTRNSDQNADHGAEHGESEHGQKGHTDRWPTVADCLVGEYPGAHPGKKRSRHPPDRVIPPVATSSDGVPAVGVGTDVLEQHDVEQQKDHSGGESDAGSARNSFDKARPGP